LAKVIAEAWCDMPWVAAGPAGHKHDAGLAGCDRGEVQQCGMLARLPAHLSPFGWI